MFAFESTTVAVQTVDLVLAGVYFMGQVDRLLRLLTLAATEPDSTFHHVDSSNDEEDQGDQGFRGRREGPQSHKWPGPGHASKHYLDHRWTRRDAGRRWGCAVYTRCMAALF